MQIVRLDHINIRTAHMKALIRFYEDILGLIKGDRPPFQVPGCWLYHGDIAVVHLVEMTEQPQVNELRMEHFALRAEGLADFLAHLRASDMPYTVDVVPGLEVRQVNIFDPDGNHIEVQFARSEQADLAPFDGRAAA